MIFEVMSVMVVLLLILLFATMRVTWFRVGLFAVCAAIYYIVNYINIEV